MSGLVVALRSIKERHAWSSLGARMDLKSSRGQCEITIWLRPSISRAHMSDCCEPIRNLVCNAVPARTLPRPPRSDRACCRPHRCCSTLRRNSAEAIRPLLFQSKDTAAYYSAVDFDVHSIGAHAECTRAQIVCVLTASNP